MATAVLITLAADLACSKRTRGQQEETKDSIPVQAELLLLPALHEFIHSLCLRRAEGSRVNGQHELWVPRVANERGIHLSQSKDCRMDRLYSSNSSVLAFCLYVLPVGLLTVQIDIVPNKGTINLRAVCFRRRSS
jgi:hypothetical protein